MEKNEKSQHVSLSFPEVDLLIKSNYSYAGYITADWMILLCTWLSHIKYLIKTITGKKRHEVEGGILVVEARRYSDVLASLLKNDRFLANIPSCDSVAVQSIHRFCWSLIFRGGPTCFRYKRSLLWIHFPVPPSRTAAFLQSYTTSCTVTVCEGLFNYSSVTILCVVSRAACYSWLFNNIISQTLALEHRSTSVAGVSK